MAQPAHHAEDSDEELTDEQVRQLLNEAEKRLREKASSHPTAEKPFTLPKLKPTQLPDTYLTTKGSITRLDQSKLVPEKDRALANGVKKIEDPVVAKRQRKEEKKATAGSSWFDLPKLDVTPQLRQDLQLLQMRNVLDPKRHYKKSDSKSAVPVYGQVGTIIEGPTEYYSSRINKKDRKQTFVEEVLAQEEESGKFKRKYDEILKSKTSGRKAHYKALKAKRRKGKAVNP
ncbi:Fcf2-domain-containing protein [Trematosphaeria pertusa]|uniref:Fcf2-domain-containing protein n=1 Tax=Trematosphaeria pertusa TaxID=390896 RepID=A0A6A6IUN5_9PLEO|nr:Fcf2-domain-containing protein [Trematosphaeria pertusa]KAF2253837.1 Fcf2-domain-containing protein [Trematosphaeria pertusa]